MVSETKHGLNAMKSSESSKKNRGKIHRKIVKAEREKSKRDHMNLLFEELGKVIEPAPQNDGKASILKNSIRLLGELFSHIESLKKENVSLLSETHYVNVEKNELKEENSALEAQIEKLQSEIEEKIQSQSSWNTSFPVLQAIHQASPHDHLREQIGHAPAPAPVLSPVIVLPLHHEGQTYTRPDTDEVGRKVESYVSRPHPRYPSQSDSWPSHILERNVDLTESGGQICTEADSFASTGLS